MKAIAT